ncbi:DUF6276 family protein [Halegenticoccus tardaugens]|uniref:DUF6276 family protein n=1 Tax=Halegenticoccus tardaugens TaxID=2071624 RepID=UPI00100B499B|nr:DUF6276 family protein [Halegenticoccus tardaugens]
MDCPHCETTAVPFAVPADVRAHAPDGSDRAAICPTCLRVYPTDEDASNPDFSRIGDFFPGGEAGATAALLLGLLDSLALNRAAIETLCARAERAGADPLLLLDRLTAADVDPHFDLERRRVQLEGSLE